MDDPVIDQSVLGEKYWLMIPATVIKETDGYVIENTAVQNLENMIKKAIQYEEGEEREHLINMLANHMKKSFLTWNKEVVDDRKIFTDLDYLSDGKIVLDEESHKLTESKEILMKKNKNLTRRQKNK